ncbi:hypothetical protein P9209_18560 [Prescottella defluvii]|nr:hypothetical protein P9209_18560 [Prescottella defluvii]
MRSRQAANVHIFHVLQTLSPHTADLDVGVPARGLHGEAYRGHVFWDDLFVFPLLNMRLPELTRALLLYRYRRLPHARRSAAAQGLRGALIPWQSGSDGREETPRVFFNPRSGRWMPDHSRRQYHVNLAVAYNVWHYWEATADLGFLAAFGAELLVENARFWASLAVYDPATDRFDIRGVTGRTSSTTATRTGRDRDRQQRIRERDDRVVVGAGVGRLPDSGRERGRGAVGTARRGRRRARVMDRLRRRLRLCFLDNGLLAQFEGYGRWPSWTGRGTGRGTGTSAGWI